MEKISAACSQKSLRASHRFLHVDIVAKEFSDLDALTDGVSSGPLGCRTLDYCVDGMASDTECRCRPLGHEHERECIKRPGPLDQPRFLEAESVPVLDKLVPYDDIVA